MVPFRACFGLRDDLSAGLLSSWFPNNSIFPGGIGILQQKTESALGITDGSQLDDRTEFPLQASTYPSPCLIR